jgi:transposase-like protein
MKIEIPKEELEKLYSVQGLSTYKIAKIYSCWATTIQDKLEKAGIEKRQPKKKRFFPKELLEDLYLNKKYSIGRIAKELGTGQGTVLRLLRQYNITTRKMKRYKIQKQELASLYLEQKVPQGKIAKQFGCSQWVIANKLAKFCLPKRNVSEINQIYERKDFSGDLIEKAYLVGFRLGDLHVRRRSSYSIIVGSNTTKKAQLDLMCSLFGKYAHVQTSCSKGVLSFSCILNNSFSFLEPKKDTIEDWIKEDDERFFSFLAGYSDAEGNIGVYGGRAKFRLGTYDKNILSQIHARLNSLGIKTNIGLELPAGSRTNGTINNGDFWRISINYKDSLLKLFKRFDPYLKHHKRVHDMKTAKENILQRLKTKGGEAAYDKILYHYSN